MLTRFWTGRRQCGVTWSPQRFVSPSRNALVSSERSVFTGWPETGLEEINGDLLEADLN
jgi:hypothetical protein